MVFHKYIYIYTNLRAKATSTRIVFNRKTDPHPLSDHHHRGSAHAQHSTIWSSLTIMSLARIVIAAYVKGVCARIHNKHTNRIVQPNGTERTYYIVQWCTNLRARSLPAQTNPSQFTIWKRGTLHSDERRCGTARMLCGIIFLAHTDRKSKMRNAANK